MIGEVFILGKNVWGCSNSCEYDVEKDHEENVLKTTYTLKVKGLFIKGEIIKDNTLNLVFRNEKNEKVLFSGFLRNQTEKKAVFVLTGRDKNEEIINKVLHKIKEEINNGR